MPVKTMATPQSVGGGDDFLVLDAAAGLDHGSGASRRNGLKAIGEGEEGVGGGDAALERQNSLHCTKLRGIHAAHLPGADAEGLTVFGVDDCVGLDVLADAPGKEQAAQLFCGRRTPGDDLQFGLVHTRSVGVLQQEPAGDMLDNGPARSRMDLDKAKVFLCGKALQGLLSEGWRGDGFDKELGDFFRSRGVHRPIDADHAAKCGDGIGSQRLLVGLEAPTRRLPHRRGWCA